MYRFTFPAVILVFATTIGCAPSKEANAFKQPPTATIGSKTILHALATWESPDGQVFEGGPGEALDHYMSQGIGIDINAGDNHGATALFEAVRFEREQLAIELIKRGADINLATQSHMTPLMMAILVNGEELSKILIDNGADIFTEDKEGNTPMHYAAYREKPLAIALLHQKGSPLHRKNNAGQTPLELMKVYDSNDLISRNRTQESIAKIESLFAELEKSELVD